jgi:signal transduction histidine kinase
MFRRPGLWVEIALTLALLTLATLLLNAGVFILVFQDLEDDRRVDLAETMGSLLAAQVEAEALRGEEARAYHRLMEAYQTKELPVSALYVIDTHGKVVASARGGADGLDAGARAAIFGKRANTEEVPDPRRVVVTRPIAPKGPVVGALRVELPLGDGALPGGSLAFALAYASLSAVAIAGFGFSLFRRSLIQPIADLGEGARRIAAGDFGHRLTIEAARELMELSQALNTASASLSAYQSTTIEQLASLQQANAELRSAQEALVRTEKLAGVGRLAAGLAHEVGNPLAAVIGYVDLLAQDLGDPELEVDLLVRSRIELQRIHRIIRQLLDYARVGSGIVEALDVAEVLHEAVDTVRPQPGFRGLGLRVEAEAGLPPLSFERDKLHQALVNLLLNAADAIATGGGGEVCLRARRLEGGLCIEALDDGPGFSAVALERAAEPFFTTKEVGQGTGLGLATCAQIAAAAGGALGVENRPGGGARVWLRLPLSP